MWLGASITYMGASFAGDWGTIATALGDMVLVNVVLVGGMPPRMLTVAHKGGGTGRAQVAGRKLNSSIVTVKVKRPRVVDQNSDQEAPLLPACALAAYCQRFVTALALFPPLHGRRSRSCGSPLAIPIPERAAALHRHRRVGASRRPHRTCSKFVRHVAHACAHGS